LLQRSLRWATRLRVSISSTDHFGHAPVVTLSRLTVPRAPVRTVSSRLYPGCREVIKVL
jgi:hypothetical protein